MEDYDKCLKLCLLFYNELKFVGVFNWVYLYFFSEVLLR